MKKTVFLCVGGDARQTYTAQTLTKIGRVYTYGMDDKGEDTIPLAHLDQLTEKADVLVLPLMKADGLDISSSRNVKVSCSDVNAFKEKCTCGRRSAPPRSNRIFLLSRLRC